jgi:hypothetical protein
VPPAADHAIEDDALSHTAVCAPMFSAIHHENRVKPSSHWAFEPLSLSVGGAGD